MNDDELRTRLTEAVADSMHCRRYVALPGCETHRMRSWPCSLAVERTHVLMPVVREALAQAKRDELHAYADALSANTSIGDVDSIWSKSDYVSDVREWADTTPGDQP